MATPTPVDATVIIPPTKVVEEMGVVLGGSLGEWSRSHPDDSIVIGTPSNSRAVSGANGVGPIEGIYCARSQRVLVRGGGWALIRQTIFLLAPPRELPPVAATPGSLRDRYCRAVAVGIELSGDSTEAAPDSLSPDSWIAWNGSGGVTPPPSWKGGPDLPRDTKVIGADGTARGDFAGGTAEPGISCFEYDAEDDYYSEESAPRCSAIFRSDTGEIMRRGFGTLAPGGFRNGSAMRWLIGQVGALDEPKRRSLLDLAADSTENELHGAVDSSVVELLEDLKGSLVNASGDERLARMMLLDITMDQAVILGRLGPDGDTGPATAQMVTHLGGRFDYLHLGAMWVDHHGWFDSVDHALPRGAIGDSLVAWYWAPRSECDAHDREVIGPSISAVRRYTGGERAGPTRARALLTMAQLWADSLPSVRSGRGLDAVVDSISADLRLGLLADERVDPSGDAHGALWRAAAGILPLKLRVYCGEGD